jgi:plasmid stabilization system protein ParE
MKRVVYHRLAASELIEAAVFYEKRRPLLGDEFLNEADATRDKIAENPTGGRPEQFALRSLKMRRFPYRLFYHVEPARLWIVAVAHLSRKPGYWTRRLK